MKESQISLQNYKKYSVFIVQFYLKYLLMHAPIMIHHVHVINYSMQAASASASDRLIL